MRGMGSKCEESGWECVECGECGEWGGNTGNQGGNAVNQGGNAGNRTEIEKTKRKFIKFNFLFSLKLKRK